MILYAVRNQKQIVWFASLWYSLYCSGLELNPQYLQGMPLSDFLLSPETQSPGEGGHAGQKKYNFLLYAKKLQKLFFKTINNIHQSS